MSVCPCVRVSVCPCVRVSVCPCGNKKSGISCIIEYKSTSFPLQYAGFVATGKSAIYIISFRRGKYIPSYRYDSDETYYIYDTATMMYMFSSTNISTATRRGVTSYLLHDVHIAKRLYLSSGELTSASEINIYKIPIDVTTARNDCKCVLERIFCAVRKHAGLAFSLISRQKGMCFSLSFTVGRSA